MPDYGFVESSIVLRTEFSDCCPPRRPRLVRRTNWPDYCVMLYAQILFFQAAHKHPSCPFLEKWALLQSAALPSVACPECLLVSCCWLQWPWVLLLPVCLMTHYFAYFTTDCYSLGSSQALWSTHCSPQSGLCFLFISIVYTYSKTRPPKFQPPPGLASSYVIEKVNFICLFQKTTLTFLGVSLFTDMKNPNSIA